MLIMKKNQAVVVTLVFVVFLALAGCGASKPVVKSVAPKEGFPGTGLKIKGTDFDKSQGKSTVHLGSKTVTASSWSATNISASVPQDMAVGNYSITVTTLSLIHISEPTRLGMISYAVFCLKKKKQSDDKRTVSDR